MQLTRKVSSCKIVLKQLYALYFANQGGYKMKLSNRIYAFALVLCMVIPMCLITVSAETAVSYNFVDTTVDFGTANNGVADTTTDPNASTLKANYDKNKFLPFGDSSKVGYLYIYDPGHATSPVVNTGCVAINEMQPGEWIAVKFKSPGAGTYDVSLRFYRTANTKCAYNAYILPGTTNFEDIGTAITSATKYASGNQMYQGMGSNGELKNIKLDQKLTVSASDKDFILVVQANELTNGAAKTRMYIEGIDLTPATAGGSTTPTVKPTTPTTKPSTPTTPPADLPDDGSYRLWNSALESLNYNGKGELTMSKQLDYLHSLYAAGGLDVVPIAEKSDMDTLLNYGAADTGNQFLFNGLKLQKATIGDYIALKFRSPGSGVYSMSLDIYYLNANNAARMAVYMLPANTAVSSIDSKLIEDNRIGYADVMSTNTANTACSVTFVNGHALEADKEYILVFQFEKDNYAPETSRVDVMMTGLSFADGFIAPPAPFDPTAGEEVVSAAIKAASAYKGTTGINPANGHDLMYLLFKGSMMLVYDLDDKVLYDKVTITHSTPMNTCFDSDGNLWVTGAGTFLVKYDPVNKQAVKYSFAKDEFFKTSTNSYGGVYVDGYVYFGYAGALGRINTTTGEIKRITDKINLNPALEPDGDRFCYSGIIHKDGYLYTSIHGDTNKDQIYTSAIVKIDLATFQVVDYIDVTFSTRVPRDEAAYGVANLYLVNDILVGTYTNRKPQVYIDISGEKMQKLDAFYNFDTHFINTLSAPINGKVYASGYVDNEATTKCIYEIDLEAKTVTRLGDITYLTALSAEEAFATITWDENLPGTSIVTYMNNSATGMVDIVFYNPTTMETVIWDSVTLGEGTGMTLRALVSDDAGRYIYMGAYGTNMITRYDIETETVNTYFGHSHQTDSLTYYKDNLYLGTYGAGAIVQLDPTTADVTPYFTLKESVFQQERMFGLTAGDNKIFCGTVPDASRTGGVLVWYDLEENRYYVASGPNPEDCYYADYASFVVWRNYVTGQIETFDRDGDGLYDYDILIDDMGDEDPTNDIFEQVIKGLIPELSVNDLVYKDGLIYGSTTRSNGDGVGAVLEDDAVLFVYDLDAKKLVSTCNPSDYAEGLENPASNYIDYIDAVAADPYEDGKFWFVVNDTLMSFRYDRENNQFTNVTEELSLAKGRGYKHATSTWHSRTILFDGDWMYVGFHNLGLYMINTADTRQAYPVSAYTPAGGMAIGQDGNIYYISNQDSSKPITSLCVMKVANDTQPLVAQSVQTLIDALPENVTMEQEAQLLTACKMYRDLREPAKALVDTTKLNAAISALADQLAAKADSLIDAIGEVTIQSGPAIRAARSYYDDLPDAVKAKVTKLAVLEAAEAKFVELRKANPSDEQDDTTDPAPKNNTLIFVIIAAAAVVVIAAAAVAVILIHKKKAASTEEKPDSQENNEE